MGSVCKEGFLYKSGKRSFQAWRKRWFILASSSLKYYNPGPVYNGSNLLGTIQMVEVQSVVPSKSSKHGIDIVTRSRTYNMSAKTDEERDDWLTALRRCHTETRGIQSNSIYSTCSDHEGKNPGKRLTKCSSLFYSDDPERSGDDLKKLSRAITVDGSMSMTDKEFESKPRASTDAEYRLSDSEAKRTSSQAERIQFVTSMKRKMSRDLDDGMTEMYAELSEEIDGWEEDEDYEVICDRRAELPPPRDDAETFAFDEIKRLFDCDVTSIVTDVINQPSNAEYPAMEMLKSFVQQQTMMDAFL